MTANQEKQFYRARILIKIFLRWWTITKLIGGLLLLLGLAGLLEGPVPYPPVPGLAKFHENISAELFGIGLTVILINTANERVATQQEKKHLILQMGSESNLFATEAVRMLRARGWLIDGSLHGADLIGANLEGADLADAEMKNVDLYAANLDHALFMSANLEGAELREAKIRRAELMMCNLSRTLMYYADFENSFLGQTNLEEAQLDDANLKGADLTGSQLKRAGLIRANLEGAVLVEANLRGANLYQANVSQEQLAQAASLKDAIMPDGTIYDGHLEKKERPMER